MAVTSVTLQTSATFAIERAVTGFTSVAYGPETVSFALTSLDAATWDVVFAETYPLAASGTQTVDLRAFTDIAGNVISSVDKALHLQVTVTGAPGDRLNVKPHGTNGLQWFFENAAYGINIPGGGTFFFSEGASSTGTTVDATNRQILLTNNGSASLTVTVIATLSDV
jgi:hypothetical protein